MPCRQATFGLIRRPRNVAMPPASRVRPAIAEEGSISGAAIGTTLVGVEFEKSYWAVG